MKVEVDESKMHFGCWWKLRGRPKKRLEESIMMDLKGSRIWGFQVDGPNWWYCAVWGLALGILCYGFWYRIVYCSWAFVLYGGSGVILTPWNWFKIRFTGKLIMLFELCSQKRCVTWSWDVLDCEGYGMRHKTGSVAINGTLRRVLLTSVAVEMQWVLHILSVCLEP